MWQRTLLSNLLAKKLVFVWFAVVLVTIKPFKYLILPPLLNKIASTLLPKDCWVTADDLDHDWDDLALFSLILILQPNLSLSLPFPLLPRIITREKWIFIWCMLKLGAVFFGGDNRYNKTSLLQTCFGHTNNQNISCICFHNSLQCQN